MTKLNDLTGRRFGRLMAVRHLTGQEKWLCDCDCGTTKAVNSSGLVRGAIRSCGCLYHEVEQAARVFSDKQIEAIRTRYQEEGGESLAAEFGVSIRQVIHKAQKLGLRSTRHWDHARRKAFGRRLRNTSANLAFFDEWSPEMAYILGYIWADGCVQANKLGVPIAVRFLCAVADEEFLRQIASALGFTGRISTDRPYLRKRPHVIYTCQPTIRFTIHSSHLAAILAGRFGVLPKKSSLDLPFPSVPDEYLSHFARGNLDGDGSVCVRYRSRGNGASVCWLGTPLWIEGLARRITSVAEVGDGRVTQHGKVLRATWYRKDAVLRLREWLYADATICLERKRARFDEAARAIAHVVPQPRRPARTSGVPASRTPGTTPPAGS